MTYRLSAPGGGVAKVDLTPGEPEIGPDGRLVAQLQLDRIAIQ